MSVKGLHHISTLDGLADRSGPHQRVAGLAELTHLEREKAGLEKKLKVLTHSLEDTEHHLGQVQERIALRERTLYPGGGDQGLAALDRGSGGKDKAGERVGRREVSLEY